MVNICSVVDEDLEDTEFVALVKDYSVSESRIQSTQKPIETNYQEQEFWDRSYCAWTIDFSSQSKY